jgi:mono/diheme cytochrome c family protein
VKTAFVAAVLALCSGAGLALAAGADSVDEGKAVFQQSCSSCHTYGGGDSVGPDLKGVLERAGEEQVRAWIATPEKVLASGDPEVDALVTKYRGVKMPNLGLETAKIDALVAYLGSESGAGGAAGGAGTTTPATPAAAGDAATGKDLFTGSTQFANGGPSCVSCHTIAGAGALGGGAVGPDLTKAYSKYGGATGVASVLATLPFPTMQPLYADHALTKSEQVDLAAFLQSASTEESPADRTWAFVLLGIGVAAGLLALALLIWPRRSLVVRRRLVSSSTLDRRS